MVKVIDAKKAFEGFIEEAKGCANHGLGASAVLMAFSAMLAAGDADTQSDLLKKQIRAFVERQYVSYDRWFSHGLVKFILGLDNTGRLICQKTGLILLWLVISEV